MDEEHRKLIQKNFVSLVEQTDLDTMVSLLYEKGVFSEQMIEPYYDITKDARTRKRLLYTDITRRGPRAFGHLLDALSEVGLWDLVRDLDSKSTLHTRRRSPISIKSDENNFVSIRTENLKTKNVGQSSANEGSNAAAQQPPQQIDNLTDVTKIPQFNVVKSKEFAEEDEKRNTRLYYTRGQKRGYLVIFSYADFSYNTEKNRKGADVDCANLKYLFKELGLQVCCYQNLTKDETESTLKFLRAVVGDGECLFIVVSSHGYERPNSSDVDVRCSDGGLISVYEFIQYFNNENFPALRGVPKVFILQMCRGNNKTLMMDGVEWDGTPCAFDSPSALGSSCARLRLPDASEQAGGKCDRVYSDILIAHSTLPGFPSLRDKEEGSWFIQALCRVFAEHAHHCHVEELFTMVDEILRKHFKVQTSAIEKWGFNSFLYLHPGLCEEPAPTM